VKYTWLSTSVGADSTTTIGNVVSSVSCVELYLQEAGTDVAQLRITFLNSAASYGRLIILEWVHQCGYSYAYGEAMCTRATCSFDMAERSWMPLKIRVSMQPRKVISISCSGPEQMDARGGMSIQVTMRPRVDISISHSGPEQIDAHGMKIRLPMQLSMDISISCSG